MMKFEYIVALVITALMTGFVFALALAFNYWFGYLVTALCVATMIVCVAVWYHNSIIDN